MQGPLTVCLVLITAGSAPELVKCVFASCAHVTRSSFDVL